MKLIDNSELDKKFGADEKTIASDELGQVSQGGEWSLNVDYTTELLKENFSQRTCWTGKKPGIFATQALAGTGARKIVLNFFKGDNGKLISLGTLQRRVKGKLATGTVGVIDSSDVRVLVEGYHGKTLTVTGHYEYDADIYGADGKTTGETQKRKQLIFTIE